MQLNNGKALGGCILWMTGIGDSSENLQNLIDVVHKLRLKANVSKCAVVVFSKSKVHIPGSWTWGEHTQVIFI